MKGNTSQEILEWAELVVWFFGAPPLFIISILQIGGGDGDAGRLGFFSRPPNEFVVEVRFLNSGLPGPASLFVQHEQLCFEIYLLFGEASL